jgi:DNA (cytosine-5)-methyltransferase 1
MKHLGDITKINGAEIEIVDVITGGSPCQDLSIAGKRAGLAGARSGLFMEQIRIVKEMREHDRANGRTGDMVRPRFMVWENVPGAFSSNKGRDFAAVLEEIIRIAEPEAPDIEVPEKGWPTWGGYHDEVGGRWSVAWRVHDAQYWGVPQRRRRISVVADFGGDTAGEILFERKSVSGHPAESGTAGERLAGNAESRAGKTEQCLTAWDCQSKRIFGTEGASPMLQGGVGGGVNNPAIFCMGTQQGGAEVRSDDRAPTLTAAAGMSENNQPVVCAGFKLGNSEQARSIGYAEEQSPTLNAECGGNKPAVLCLNDQGGNVMGVSHDVSGTLRAQEHGHQPTVLDMSRACDVIRDCGEVAPSLQARMGTGGNQVPLTYQMQGFGDYREGEVASSCKQRDFKDSTDLVCAIDCRNFREGGETNGTLQAKSNGGTSYNLQNTVRTGMIVRRLTPMECERLQGFPDGWTDIGEWYDSQTGDGYWVDSCGKRHKTADSPRYKALGNSIALPFWDFLAKRISAQYLRPVTMGSLFDGIGGFPLVFERHNGKGTARWASEIEEFPIAVTKLRFGEDRSVTAQ